MIELSDLPQKELFKGFKGQFIHAQGVTLAYWDVEEGAVLPTHAHFHEQITTVVTGQFELTVGNQTNVYKPGQIAVIPSNVPHAGKALTACKLMDVFSPVREDYR